MYNKQLGILPMLVKFIVPSMLFYSLVTLVRLVVLVLQDRLPLEFPKLVGLIILGIGVAVFLLFPFILLGLILVSIFSSLKVESQGIKCKFLIFTELLKWDELTKVKSVWGDNQAIVINRHGFFLFNGLYKYR